ncbi:MAG: hypothetical protein R2867_24405 [Caldilineaceae bacterium]
MRWDRLLFFILGLPLVTVLATNAASTFNAGTVYAQSAEPVGCTREWYIPHAVVAALLEMDEMNLYQELEQGKSIADLAEAQAVDEQLIIDALVETEGELVRKMARGGCLEAAEAEAWLAGLPEKMRAFVEAKAEIDDAGRVLDNLVFLPLLMK